MEDYDKTKLIEEISLSVGKYQEKLGSVSGSAVFLSTVAQFPKRSNDELKKLLFELHEKNIQSALNQNESLVKEVKEKHGDTSNINVKLNQLKRQFADITKEKEDSINEQNEKYISLFDDVITSINHIKDNKQKLISEGKRKYLKIYLLAATLITVFYCFISGLYFKWSIDIIKENLLMTVLLWLIILYMLWQKLYDWINKN